MAEIEALLLAGHPDIQGLCLALADWSAELRLIENYKNAERARTKGDLIHGIPKL
ncbi:MAG TPA: hypothetical protein VK335_16380 [Bryobacteraceae bacterium]|nr:hypothetical protein [Bryobacteraceae bacterium]